MELKILQDTSPKVKLDQWDSVPLAKECLKSIGQLDHFNGHLELELNFDGSKLLADLGHLACNLVHLAILQEIFEFVQLCLGFAKTYELSLSLQNWRKHRLERDFGQCKHDYGWAELEGRKILMLT